jgi:Signal transduction histidine kinase
MTKHRNYIGLKMTVIIAALALVYLTVSVALSYFFLFDILRNGTMDSRKDMANIMAGSVADIIDSQMKFANISASTGLVKEAVDASNAKYAGMSAEAARQYILDVDGKWTGSADDHPLVQEYLTSQISQSLKYAAETELGFFNILVADKYGALVGASQKEYNFYFGNEEWFKEAISGTKTGYISTETVLDESSGKWVFPIALPVLNDAGEIIGAYKALVDISVLFKPLQDFVGAGKSGNAALIDGRGYLIYYPGTKAFSNKFCDYEELKKLLINEKGYSDIDTAYKGRGKTAVAFSPVMSPALYGRTARLYVVVSESNRELFSPLNKLALSMSVFSIILALLISIAAWAVFRGSFTGPIRELIDGMRRLGEGKLDFRVNIRTGDELEDLGAALNDTAQSLSTITNSVKMLDKEKLECKITQQKYEKENTGFLSLMSEVHGLLLDINKGVEAAKQDAVKSQNDKQKAWLEQLEIRSAGLINSLEKDIYAARIETGSLEFKSESKDFRDIIKESVFAFEPKIRDKGLDLKLDIPRAALPIRADKDKIRQALGTLVGNSLMATEKGYIAISVIQTQDWVECSVSDTGIAIPKELISGIFDRFTGFSRISPQGGTQIDPSLYILRQIIEKHGGRVFAESDPGNVTKFTIRLPKAVTP